MAEAYENQLRVKHRAFVCARDLERAGAAAAASVVAAATTIATGNARSGGGGGDRAESEEPCGEPAGDESAPKATPAGAGAGAAAANSKSSRVQQDASEVGQAHSLHAYMDACYRTELERAEWELTVQQVSSTIHHTTP